MFRFLLFLQKSMPMYLCLCMPTFTKGQVFEGAKRGHWVCWVRRYSFLA